MVKIETNTDDENNALMPGCYHRNHWTCDVFHTTATNKNNAKKVRRRQIQATFVLGITDELTPNQNKHWE